MKKRGVPLFLLAPIPVRPRALPAVQLFGHPPHKGPLDRLLFTGDLLNRQISDVPGAVPVVLSMDACNFHVAFSKRIGVRRGPPVRCSVSVGVQSKYRRMV